MYHVACGLFTRHKPHVTRGSSAEKWSDQSTESEVEKNPDAEQDKKREPRHDARQRNCV